MRQRSLVDWQDMTACYNIMLDGERERETERKRYDGLLQHNVRWREGQRDREEKDTYRGHVLGLISHESYTLHTNHRPFGIRKEWMHLRVECLRSWSISVRTKPSQKVVSVGSPGVVMLWLSTRGYNVLFISCLWLQWFTSNCLRWTYPLFLG